jgi:hypothetical protein
MTVKIVLDDESAAVTEMGEEGGTAGPVVQSAS